MIACLAVRLLQSAMGERNFLIEGISGSGKTSVATMLESRGFDVIHGDRLLAYQGDPQTGVPVMPRPQDPAFVNAHHIWDVDQLKRLIDDQTHPRTFFCGASRNRHHFAQWFDAIFVLETDWATISRRLDGRPGEWGDDPRERSLIQQLHISRIDLPIGAIAIDATRPLHEVVDAILARC